MIGLTNAQYRPVREYSKGMQRRIGLAQALINDPDFLILDEPTTGLDPIGTRQVKDLIIELGRRGKTVLLSSHLLADVEDCVDRMCILYGGRKREEGTTDRLLVAQDRITIETDTLDDETIAQIDQLIRSRTGGEHAISRVTKPRQTLESLFLDIVDRAQSEQLTTSGAVHGGETASFLKGDESEGETLIDELVAAGNDDQREAVEPMPIDEPEPAPKSGPDEDVIEGLVREEPEAPRPAPAPRQETPRESDVDLDLIEGLTEDRPDGDGKGGS